METVKDIAILWQTSRPPIGWREAVAARSRLFTAAVHTMSAKAAANIPYDPVKDALFQWCVQWLQIAEGERTRIDEELTVSTAMLLNPTPLIDRKSLAAGH